jgi:hypothetical protein
MLEPVWEINEVDRAGDGSARLFLTYSESSESNAAVRLLWDLETGTWQWRQADEGFATRWEPL